MHTRRAQVKGNIHAMDLLDHLLSTSTIVLFRTSDINSFVMRDAGNVKGNIANFQFTHHAPRITHHVSRFTFHVSWLFFVGCIRRAFE